MRGYSALVASSLVVAVVIAAGCSSSPQRGVSGQDASGFDAQLGDEGADGANGADGADGGSPNDAAPDGAMGSDGGGLTNDAAPRSDGGGGALGTVTNASATTCPNGTPNGSTCKRLTVSACPGIENETIDATLAI